MGSRSAFLAGGLIFSEETTEDILDHRAELMEEIDGLQEEIHRLYNVKDLPKQIAICNTELIRLEDKRKAMETEIENLYEEKKEQLAHNVEEEAKKLKGRNEKYKKTGEALKGEIKALHVEKKDIEESITLRQTEIEEIKKKFLHSKEIRDDMLKNAEISLRAAEEVRKEIDDDRKFVNEALVILNNDKKLFKIEVEDFDKEKEMSVRFIEEARKKVEGKERELTSNLEKRREELDRQNAECKVARREIEAIGEQQEIERDVLRAWRSTLDKREEVISKREEDLDINWTLFERERGARANG